jgi:hypothetical protein
MTVLSDALQLRFSKEPAAEGQSRRGIGFGEAPELFSRPYWLDRLAASLDRGSETNLAKRVIGRWVPYSAAPAS